MSVCIISHMGDKKPDIEAAADMLTTFFSDFSFVSSYVCVSNVASYSTRMCANEGFTYEQYNKNIVVAEKKRNVKIKGREYNITTYLKKMVSDTMSLGSIACDVMILLCHGSTVRRNGGEQCTLLFEENETAKHMEVWPGAQQNVMTLSRLIGRSKMVILPCCLGQKIMKEYLATTVNRHEHDILVFYGEGVWDFTTYILYAWLVCSWKSGAKDLVEADEKGENISIATLVRDIIRSIIQKIANCVNAESFWNLLQTEGCVVHNDDNTFSILGKIDTYYMQQDTTKDLWTEFQTLTLIRCNTSSGTRFFDILHQGGWDGIEQSSPSGVTSGSAAMDIQRSELMDMMTQLNAFVMDK
jgi:hypothetical protein